MLQFNMKNAAQFVSQQELENLRAQMKLAQLQTLEKNGPGNDFLGWVDLPVEYDKDEFIRIKEAAARIQEHSDLLVVVGIGGSYLGARAVIELLSHHFNDYLTTEERTYPRIIFAGNNISGAYLADLLDVLDHYSVSINVISKSGTTTEPAIAFRILRNYMEERYGKEKAKERIFCTTDRAVGALKHLADQEGYETFIIPDDIGGRYSVLTPVGLLPIAVAGISIDDLMAGAAQGRERFANTKFSSNDAALYAAVRTCLMRKGYEVEILVNYEPAFHYMTEWWKQLYGESDGKDNRGLFPAGVDFSTDLHSMGQFIQAGRRIMFETVVNFEDAGRTVEIPHEEADLDGLNFLAGMGMDEVNQKALQGTVLAHVDGGVPNVQINVSERTPFSCGELMYFFEIACAFGGYLNAINPFNQPGVEAYKTNMYSLLGKPGYEEEGKKLQARIDSTQ